MVLYILRVPHIYTVYDIIVKVNVSSNVTLQPSAATLKKVLRHLKNMVKELQQRREQEELQQEQEEEKRKTEMYNSKKHTVANILLGIGFLKYGSGSNDRGSPSSAACTGDEEDFKESKTAEQEQEQEQEKEQEQEQEQELKMIVDRHFWGFLHACTETEYVVVVQHVLRLLTQVERVFGLMLHRWGFGQVLDIKERIQRFLEESTKKYERRCQKDWRKLQWSMVNTWMSARIDFSTLYTVIEGQRLGLSKEHEAMTKVFKGSGLALNTECFINQPLGLRYACMRSCIVYVTQHGEEKAALLAKKPFSQQQLQIEEREVARWLRVRYY